MRFIAVAAALAVAVSGCATSPKSFYDNPGKAPVTNLCRAAFETTNPKYQSDVVDELVRRGLSYQECKKRVDGQNVALATTAVVLTGVAVGVAASNGGMAGGAPSYGYGRYGVAWDQFRGPYGNLIWRCRDKSNGEFVDDYRCAGTLKDDYVFPGV